MAPPAPQAALYRAPLADSHRKLCPVVIVPLALQPTPPSCIFLCKLLPAPHVPASLSCPAGATHHDSLWALPLPPSSALPSHDHKQPPPLRMMSPLSPQCGKCRHGSRRFGAVRADGRKEVGHSQRKASRAHIIHQSSQYSWAWSIYLVLLCTPSCPLATHLPAQLGPLLPAPLPTSLAVAVLGSTTQSLSCFAPTCARPTSPLACLQGRPWRAAASLSPLAPQQLLQQQ